MWEDLFKGEAIISIPQSGQMVLKIDVQKVVSKEPLLQCIQGNMLVLMDAYHLKLAYLPT